jgi:CheY-like chemotaxis protein/PAS domain-containing protein
LAEKPNILSLSDSSGGPSELVQRLRELANVTEVRTPLRAVNLLGKRPFAGMFVDGSHLQQVQRLGHLLENERILDGMPDGVVMVDPDNSIVWANSQFIRWTGMEQVAGEGFYAVLGNPEIVGPDFCPFHTALATGQPSTSTLRISDNRYFQTHAAPTYGPDGVPRGLIVMVRDITAETLQQQKLAAIHKAGIELADLTPDEIFDMQVDDRIELLKANILHHTQHLLNFNVVEIRLLDEKSGELLPLLAVGMCEEAASRPLFARPQNNGVTGFVAATGKSYLCEDTTEDPLYLQGFAGAKSSLTVPLVFHDQVIGTFNVESPEPRAFAESDLQFLEIFSRNVAAALNTLELMVAQKASTAQESVEAIHGAVALPVDEILNDAVNIMEHYIGHDPDVSERLHRILRNARDIKQVIQKIGQRMAPAEAVPASATIVRRPKLRDARILVVDANDAVRNDAHALLEKFGCFVETAHNGGEAMNMVRNTGADGEYDVIISDIRLTDFTGYELLVKLKEVLDPVPLVLMSGFGYDPSHSMVKARQAGLHPKAILYKPFRLDQLLDTVETMIDVFVQVPQT